MLVEDLNGVRVDGGKENVKEEIGLEEKDGNGNKMDGKPYDSELAFLLEKKIY